MIRNTIILSLCVLIGVSLQASEPSKNGEKSANAGSVGSGIEGVPAGEQVTLYNTHVLGQELPVGALLTVLSNIKQGDANYSVKMLHQISPDEEDKDGFDSGDFCSSIRTSPGLTLSPIVTQLLANRERSLILSFLGFLKKNDKALNLNLFDKYCYEVNNDLKIAVESQIKDDAKKSEPEVG